MRINFSFFFSKNSEDFNVIPEARRIDRKLGDSQKKSGELDQMILVHNGLD